VRIFSSDCAVDAGGLPVLLLTGVDPVQSLRLLAGYVETGGEGERRGDHIGDGALAAIAYHAGPGADETLEGFVRPGRPEWLRKKAAFWLGQARGERGYRALARMMREDPSPDVRAHVTFALSQSDVPEALPEMIRAARGDQSSEVRGQALFWLAQKAGDKAAREITRAIDDDPDTDVKEKAVFALSQLPRDQGVPLLIDVARNNRNREVRKKAMFWLGQSNDERALEFIEAVLTR
jgi:HEAT repeat protein